MKKRLGLLVSFPDRSYEELVCSTTKRTLSSRAATGGSRSALGVLGALFGKRIAQKNSSKLGVDHQSISKQQAAQSISESIVPETKLAESTPENPANESSPTSSSDSESFNPGEGAALTFERLDPPEPAEEATPFSDQRIPAPPQRLPELLQDTSFPLEISLEPVPEEREESVPVETLNSPLEMETATKEENSSKRAPEEEGTFSSWMNTQIAESRRERRQDTPIFGETKSVIQQETVKCPPIAAHDEMSRLFDQAVNELRAVSFDSFEVSYGDVLKREDREDIELFFSLAKDTLLTPETDQVFKDRKTVVKEVIESEYLKEQVSEAERAMRSPVYSLKKGNATPLQTREVSQASLASTYSGRVQLASALRRIAASLIDFSFFVVVVVVSTLLALQLFDGDIFVSLFLVQTDGPLVQVATTFYLLLSLALWSFLYPLITPAMFGEQLGHRLCGLKTIRIDGKSASLLDFTVRSACFPLSLIVFGFLPLLFGRRTLHELLSGTLLLTPERKTEKDL